MQHFSRRALVLAAFLPAACGSSSSSSPATPALTVTATIEAGGVSGVTNGVKANGSNSVTINISGGTTGPIKVTTHKGAFSGGAQTAMIEGTSGSVVLFTCDAHTDTTCAGSTTVSATDASFAFGQISLSFVGFETNCSNRIDDNHDG